MGHWKSFDELEENLSLAELNQVLDSSRKAKHEQNRFLAAIQGVDIDKGSKNTDAFEEVKRRAEAKLKGLTEEELDLSEVGIQIEMEDE